MKKIDYILAHNLTNICDWINKNGVKKEDIQDITYSVSDGVWILIYWHKETKQCMRLNKLKELRLIFSARALLLFAFIL